MDLYSLPNVIENDFLYNKELNITYKGSEKNKAYKTSYSAICGRVKNKIKDDILDRIMSDAINNCVYRVSVLTILYILYVRNIRKQISNVHILNYIDKLEEAISFIIENKTYSEMLEQYFPNHQSTVDEFVLSLRKSMSENFTLDSPGEDIVVLLTAASQIDNKSVQDNINSILEHCSESIGECYAHSNKYFKRSIQNSLNTCINSLYNIFVSKYGENNVNKETDEAFDEYIKDKGNENKLTEESRSYICNLFDLILEEYKDSINFIEVENQVYLINKIVILGENKIIVVSGKNQSKFETISRGKKEKLVRYGKTFTLVIDN